MIKVKTRLETVTAFWPDVSTMAVTVGRVVGDQSLTLVISQQLRGRNKGRDRGTEPYAPNLNLREEQTNSPGCGRTNKTQAEVWIWLLKMPARQKDDFQQRGADVL